MRKIYIVIFISIFVTNCLKSQNWTATGALDATGKNQYLTCATNVGHNIYVVNANQNFAYSTDLGVTWISTGTTKPKGRFAVLVGVKDRLYASMSLNTYDNDLLYSKDNGQTWVIDTIGLPRSLTNEGIAGIVLKDMGNNYMFAHNYSKAFYKKVEETNWKPTEISSGIVDVAATKNNWIIVSGKKILKSSNNGASWTTIETTGLPDKFQGNKIATNGSRIFMSNAPAAGGDQIYYSDDEGSTWTLSNSSGLYTHNNPWVQQIYAVDDYVFAAISPVANEWNTPPPFIVSTGKTPNFTAGDTSGFLVGVTTSYLPFFFHVQNKLYTMFWDLFVSEPGFTGNSSASVENISLPDNLIVAYPNPATKTIQITNKSTENFTLEIFSIQGEALFQQKAESEISVDISDWAKGIYFVKSTNQNGAIQQTKFIKR